jgi:sugar phosphate isomerase/epimerase
LPLGSSEGEIAAVLRKVNSAGIELSGCGVIYMTTEAEVHRSFAYAAAAGIRMIVGAPTLQLLGLVERKVKETGIALAIHNHGPGDERYPTPESAYRAVSGRDNRLGLCIDVGHTQRSGLDPSAEVERFFDRILDIHCKDVSAPTEAGTTVEIGRGIIDVGRLLRTLTRWKYTGTLHCEHEKDEKDPLPGVAESVGYLRGVLSSIA